MGRIRISRSQGQVPAAASVLGVCVGGRIGKNIHGLAGLGVLGEPGSLCPIFWDIPVGVRQKVHPAPTVQFFRLAKKKKLTAM